MSVLSAIPLPLRIVVTLLLGIIIVSVIGKIASSIFVLLAVVLWLLVLVSLFYEFGWLNFISAVPVASTFFGFLTNRRQVTDSDVASGQDAPRGTLDDEEREQLFHSAAQELTKLAGIAVSQDDIEQKIVTPARLNMDNPFCTQSPALVIVFHGPRGNGKTTAARCTARMLVGLHALESAKVITIKNTDLRGGSYGSATQLGLAKAREAIDGTLLIDDADWLLSDSPYGGEAGPGVDLGLAILDVAQQYPRRILIVLTSSTQTADRLKQDDQHARWLGKLTVRDIKFENLDDEALLAILSKQLDMMGWRFDDPVTERAAARLLHELQDRRQDSFDNAEACRRVAEQLVEISVDENDESAASRHISRKSVRYLDDHLE